MQEVTKEQIAQALQMLGKARLGVAYAEVVGLDLIEKANKIIAEAERRVSELTPSDSEDASEAGGTDTSTRQDKLSYIKSTLEGMLGYAGIWANKAYTNGASNTEINNVYKQCQGIRQRNPENF